MDDKPSNPFTQARVPIATTTSLLSYGDSTVTFFNRLNNNKLYHSQASFATQKQAQARILQKYQKQIYSIDIEGHCLAESLLDQMITDDGDKKQDFWQKLKSQVPKKQRKNPFGFTNKDKDIDQLVIASHTKKIVQQKLNKTNKGQQIANKRHSARGQIIKLKDIIKKQKQKQDKAKGKTERQKFSLVNMYKAKRENDQLPKTITVTQIPSEPQVYCQKIKEEYPSTIRFRDVAYYSIPL